MLLLNLDSLGFAYLIGYGGISLITITLSAFHKRLRRFFGDNRINFELVSDEAGQARVSGTVWNHTRKLFAHCVYAR